MFSQEFVPSPEQRAILDFLLHFGPSHVVKVARHLGVNSGEIRPDVRALFAEGLIWRRGDSIAAARSWRHPRSGVVLSVIECGTRRTASTEACQFGGGGAA